MKFRNLFILGLMILLFVEVIMAAPTILRLGEETSNYTFTELNIQCFDNTRGVGRIELYDNNSGIYSIVNNKYSSGSLDYVNTSAVNININFTTNNVMLTSNDLPLDRKQGVHALFMTNTSWTGANQGYYYQLGAGDWIQYQFLTQYEIQEIVVEQHLTLYEEGMTVFYSLDGTTWTQLNDFNITGPSYTFVLTNPVNATYMKFYFDEDGDFINYINIRGYALNASSVEKNTSTLSQDEKNIGYYCKSYYLNNSVSTSEIFNIPYTNYIPTTELMIDKSTYNEGENIKVNYNVISSGYDFLGVQCFNNYIGNDNIVYRDFATDIQADYSFEILNLSNTSVLEKYVEVIRDPESDYIFACEDSMFGYQCPGELLRGAYGNPSYYQGIKGNSYIIYDLGGVYNITDITWYGHGVVDDYGLKNFSVYYSDNYTDLDYDWIKAYDSESNITEREGTVSVDVPKTRYVRMRMHSGNVALFLYYFQFTGHPYVFDKNIEFSFDTDYLEGNYNGSFNISCDSSLVSRTYDSKKQQQYNLISRPDLLNHTTYKLSGLIDETYYVYSLVEDVYTNLNTNLEYRLKGGPWKETTTTYVSPHLVEVIGDSITSSGIYITPLIELLNTNNTYVSNLGVSGNTCDQIIDRFNENVTAGSTLIIWCGINDLVGGADMAEVSADMIEIQKLAEAKGNTIIWTTGGTATAYPTIYDELEELYNWITTNFTKNYDFILADTYKVLWNGTQGVCAPGLCNADGLHLNSYGGDVAAQAIWEQGFNKEYFGSYKSIINIEPPTDDFEEITTTTVDLRIQSNNSELFSEYYIFEDEILINVTEDWCLEKSFFWTEDACFFGEVEKQTISPGGSTGIISISFENGIVTRRLPRNVLIKMKSGELDSSFKILEVEEDKVSLNFSREVVDINLNESGKVDLDSDGYYDVEVFYSGSKGYFADLTITEIHEKVPSVQEEAKVVKDEIVEKEEVEKKGFFRRLWEWFIGLFRK